MAESQNSKIKQLTAKLRDNTPRTQIWQDYLQAALTNTSQAQATKAELEDIPGIPDEYQAQMILDEFRTHTGDFAQALEGWTAIRQAAKIVTTKLINSGAMAA